EGGENAVGDPPSQQPECLDSCLAGADLLCEVDSAFAAESLLGHRSHMEGCVDASVASSRESDLHVVAGPDGDGCGAVEPREGVLTGEAVDTGGLADDRCRAESAHSRDGEEHRILDFH